MKCQLCEKPATFHITELTGAEVKEVHLCEEHAREYLAAGPEEASAPSLAGILHQQLQVGQAAEEMARLDQRACPVCGITFFEFRKHGRLGCPHDYLCFQNELDPLLANIHGDIEHKGKRPKHGPGDTDQRTSLIRLRREMKEAVDREDYERASRLRDQIRRAEEGSGDSARGDSARGDSARGDSARGDSARGDSARGDSARGDSARGDSARGDKEPPQ